MVAGGRPAVLNPQSRRHPAQRCAVSLAVPNPLAKGRGLAKGTRRPATRYELSYPPGRVDRRCAQLDTRRLTVVQVDNDGSATMSNPLVRYWLWSSEARSGSVVPGGTRRASGYSRLFVTRVYQRHLSIVKEQKIRTPAEHASSPPRGSVGLKVNLAQIRATADREIEAVRQRGS